jgi:hypothetical protein
MAVYVQIDAPPDDFTPEQRRWLDDSFRRITNVIAFSPVAFAQFDEQLDDTFVPPKPQPGLLAYVGPGVVHPINAGFVFWDGNAWQNL